MDSNKRAWVRKRERHAFSAAWPVTDLVDNKFVLLRRGVIIMPGSGWVDGNGKFEGNRHRRMPTRNGQRWLGGPQHARHKMAHNVVIQEVVLS